MIFQNQGLCCAVILCPVRAEHSSPGQGVLAAALGFRNIPQISRPVRARENQPCLALSGRLLLNNPESPGRCPGLICVALTGRFVSPCNNLRNGTFVIPRTDHTIVNTESSTPLKNPIARLTGVTCSVKNGTAVLLWHPTEMPIASPHHVVRP